MFWFTMIYTNVILFTTSYEVPVRITLLHMNLFSILGERIKLLPSVVRTEGV